MAKKYSVLEGTIDGVNRTFTLPVGEVYMTGSGILIHNGLTIHRTDTYGYSEVDSNTILLNIAPQSSDTLLFFYDDNSVENTVIDINVTGNTMHFQTDWNGQQYKIEYSIELSKVEYNSSSYSLNYNTNGFVI